MGAQIIEHEYVPRGAVRELWDTHKEEVLVEGPAGTGKTRGILEWAFAQCELFPEIRILFVRDTRKSMNDTVLTTFELEVVPPGHPILSGPTKEHRDFYQWPSTDGKEGARIVLGGMDHPDRFMSGFFDIVILFEAIEVRSPEKYEKLLTRIRWFKHPKYQCAILDTNPGSPGHWINRRANSGKMHRLYSRHEDNPVYFNHATGQWTEKGKAYRGRLSRLTGARRKIYYLGQWAAEEGQVWEFYDPAVHEIYAPDIDKDTGLHQWDNLGITDWYGSMDYGWTKPGCLQVWGAKTGPDGLKVAYRVLEIYRTQRHLEWWAEKVSEVYREFPMQTIWVDPSEPALIEKINDHMGPLMGRGVPRLAVEADNAILSGVDTVGWALGNQEYDETSEYEPDPPRMFFVKDAHRFGIDAWRRDNLLPVRTEEEIASYVWPKLEDGKVFKQVPDDDCEDHGCDATRYFAMGIWDYRLSKTRAPQIKKGSVADVCGWGEKDEGRKPWRPGTGGRGYRPGRFRR